MDLGLGLNVETAAKLGIPAGSAILGYLERRKIKASIEKLKAAQQDKRQKRKAEKEMTAAKKKEIKDLVLAVTGDLGEMSSELVELGETTGKTPKQVLEDLEVDDDLGDDGEVKTPSGNASECPRCGAHVEKEYWSCPNCAAQLKQECPGCHELVNASFKSCPLCGTTFSKLWDPMADVRGD